MQYRSTRGKVHGLSFSDAVMMGLAEDGGLLIPASIPKVDLSEKPYPELARHIFEQFAPGLPWTDFIARAYSKAKWPRGVAPLTKLGRHHLLELYHGPTYSFKDVALQLLGELFEHLLQARDDSMNILAATSGDTGGAAIYGVRGRERINIFVMHPKGRISRVQELQMTSCLEPNVFNLAVETDFDGCQQLLKELSSDLEFKRRYRLGAVNSVNWARVLAQTVYYFHAWHQLGSPDTIGFCVPTGNFGDVLAGWYAAQMGLPVERLVVATNDNDILARFFQTGVYRRGPAVATLAPAMDIQVASNFERYLWYRLGDDPLRDFSSAGEIRVEGGDPLWRAGRASREDILGTIRETYERHGQVIDPHTAAAVSVAQSFEEPLVCLATADPMKFPEAVTEALGHTPAFDRPGFEGLPTRCFTLKARSQDLREFVASAVDTKTPPPG